MVNDGTEFKGGTTKLVTDDGVQIRRAEPGHHRSQAFAESFAGWRSACFARSTRRNSLPAKQTASGFRLYLPLSPTCMNPTKTLKTGLVPVDAIKMRRMPLAASLPTEKPPTEVPLEVGTEVYIAVNQEDPQGKGRRRPTDPWWTSETYPILRRVIEPGQPILYYTAYSKHSFERSQLCVVTGSQAANFLTLVPRITTKTR